MLLDSHQTTLPQSEVEILNLNKIAMDQLREDNPNSCAEALQQALTLLDTRSIKNKLSLKAITLNNLGCYFKRIGEYETALMHLENALNLEISSKSDVVKTAGTILNLSSIKSILGEHQQAINHALRAAKLLNQNYMDSVDYLQTLVIAYHSIGIEFECLGEKEKAKQQFLAGWEFAKEKLGVNHPLTRTMHSCYKQDVQAKRKKGARPFQLHTEVDRLYLVDRICRRKNCAHNHSQDEHRKPRIVHKRLEPVQRRPEVQQSFRSLSLPKKLNNSVNNTPKKLPKLVQNTPPQLVKRSPGVVKQNPLGQQKNRQISADPAPKVKRRAPPPIQYVKGGQKQKVSPYLLKRLDHPSKLYKIIKIQATIRMFLTRRRYVRQIDNIVLIQKNVRCFLVNSLYKNIRDAILFIQALWRGYLARKLANKLRLQKRN